MSLVVKKQWKTQHLPGMKRGITEVTEDGEKDGVDTYVLFKYNNHRYKYHHYKKVSGDFIHIYSEISKSNRAMALDDVCESPFVSLEELKKAVKVVEENDKKSRPKREPLIVDFFMV